MVNAASLDRIAGIARAAGSDILGVKAGAAGVDLKADRSPVTEADRAAHRRIVGSLEAWTPGVPVISEEGELPPFDRRAGWPRFWLVDPLDGTKEFIAGSGEYTVNIALIDDGQPVLGVVHAPAMQVLYVAGRGLGAWKENGSSGRRRIESSPPPADGPFTIVESRSHPSAELERYLQTVRVKTRVHAGSSLKFCWVAEGKADLYPRFGPTMEWDTAAGDCVFRCSGTASARQSPLRYNTPTMRHESFVIGLE